MNRYCDFVFVKDEQDNYKLIDCSKKPHTTWHTTSSWIVENKTENIVVFVYQAKIMGDTGLFSLAFTSKENFQNRYNESFDFNKICRLGTEFDCFFTVQDYITNKFKYLKSNIFEENNNVSRKYKELGIFNI